MKPLIAGAQDDDLCVSMEFVLSNGKDIFKFFFYKMERNESRSKREYEEFCSQTRDK